MSPMSLTSTQLGTDSWGITAEADRRYRRVLIQVSAPVLAFLILAPFVPSPVIEPKIEEEITRQYVELLPSPIPEKKLEKSSPPKAKAPAPTPEKAKELPKPKVVPTPKVQPKPDPEAQRAAAKAAAERAGIAAIRDQLAGLRSADESAMNSAITLQSSAEPSRNTEPEIIRARSNSTGSGELGARAVSSTQQNTSLSAHQTKAVQAPVSVRNNASSATARSGGQVAARTLEEIQLAFDRSKGAFYAIFSRAARSDTSITAGTIVISLTIAPDGTVTDCRIVSSNFRNQELHQKVLQRVKLLKFDAKSVPSFTYPNYPINYLPS